MNFEVLFELCLFLIFIVFTFQVLTALDLSKLFKKGYTGHIRLFYVISTIIIAYLLTSAVMHFIDLTTNLVN